MKNMKLFIPISLALLLLFSCTNSKTSEITEVQIPAESVSLQGDAYSFSSEIFRPAKLYIAGNKLIVFDDIQEKLFKVFALPELNYLYSFSNQGGGPNEFQSVDKEGINVNKDIFEILYRNKIYRYQVGDSTFTPLEEDSSALVSTSISPINNFRRIYDHVYVFNNDLQKSNKEFCMLDMTQKEERSFGEIDSKHESEIPEQQDKYYAKAICSNDQQERFAAFYYYRPSFGIYDKEGNLMKNVAVSPSEYPFDPKTMYFVEPFATENHIYVMWVFMNKQEVERDFNAFQPEIFVFDWDGNFVKRLKLDKPIITFAVSEEQKALYAVSFLEEDINKVYKFKLPE